MKRIELLLLLTIAPYLGFSQVWSNIGMGFSNGMPYSFSLQDKLYMGVYGTNVSACGVPVTGICSFDGNKIDSLGHGVSFGYAYSTAWYNGKLIVGGDFGFAGQDQIQNPNTVNIAVWDTVSKTWSSITPSGGCNNAINALQVYNGNLYAGGTFVQINGLTNCHRIAKWNGTSWSYVSGGVTGGMGDIKCMAIYHNQLYVGGNFTMAGNVPAYFIARWNGTQWDSVGGGFNNYVWAMTVDTANDLLYAAGGFTRVENTTCLGVAVWNDTSWAPVGSGLDTLWGTHCLAVYNGELYAGGGNVTMTSQGDTINNVYKFNGTKWVSVDGGANNTVEYMTVFGGNLYIGGYFWQVGYGVTALRFACYGTTCPTTTGIAETPPAIPVRVFPNPANEVLHIESDDPSELIFRLIDSNGKLIAEETFFQKMEFSTGQLAAGIYSVSVGLKDGSRMNVQKVIIQ